MAEWHSCFHRKKSSASETAKCPICGAMVQDRTEWGFKAGTYYNGKPAKTKHR
jgi:hypothetical protein